MILAGTKRHTIRAKRKIPPRVGEMCHCYVNPRQKTMRLLGRWPCVKVQEIVIGTFRPHVKDPIRNLLVSIDGICLSWDERQALAKSDGFASFAEMAEFWKGRLPFKGDIIHWNPEAKV